MAHQIPPPQTPTPPTKRDERAAKRARKPKFPWSWQGAVALILSAAIVFGITILALGVAFRVQGTPIPEQLAGLLTAVISGIVGILGTFLGRFGSGTGGRDSNAGSSAEQRRDKESGL